MLDLNQLAVFIRVVDEGSFTAAGNSLNIPKSRVSRTISDLERSLGVRLLERSTRQVSLTQVGDDYYQSCKPLVESISSEHERIADRQGTPNGLLRISSPKSGGTGFFGKLLAKFQAMYPDVLIEVVHTDKDVNLIEEKFDLGFYGGELADSSMIARMLVEDDRVLCATPEYIAKCGGPAKIPEDLKRFNLISEDGIQPQNIELSNSAGQTQKVKVAVNISIDHRESIVSAALNHAGIAVLSFFDAGEHFMSGRLLPIFGEEWVLPPEPVYLMYPSREHLPLKVRKFVDFMVDEVENVMNTIDEHENVEDQFKAYQSIIEV